MPQTCKEKPLFGSDQKSRGMNVDPLVVVLEEMNVRFHHLANGHQRHRAVERAKICVVQPTLFRRPRVELPKHSTAANKLRFQGIQGVHKQFICLSGFQVRRNDQQAAEETDVIAIRLKSLECDLRATDEIQPL